ncbi:LADA_0F05754g1_1 [Lachancea dasiensis]|uniref:Anaphase-promoting complex subunit 11 n=1 Tax=Lachancea dasiensis TaxID=1072105 RepID=A0A1G4JJM4_9SACH|nr:LADA_0F05754g1_1 [Lachancea dasiensis]
MLLEFEKVYPVFSWSWDIPGDENAVKENGDEDLCGICRVSYNGTCPSCKYPGDDCPLVIGECNHNFHVHCIQQWLDTPTAKGLCPMCRQPFSLKRNVAINEFQMGRLAKVLINSQPATLNDDQDMMMEPEFVVR